MSLINCNPEALVDGSVEGKCPLEVNGQDRVTPGNCSRDTFKTCMNGAIGLPSVEASCKICSESMHGVFTLGSISWGSEVGFQCFCLEESLFSS